MLQSNFNQRTLQQKWDELLIRVQSIHDDLQTEKKLPPVLSSRISYKDYEKIINYIYTHFHETTTPQWVSQLKSGKNIYIKKQQGNDLPRSLMLFFHPRLQEFVITLETKTKNEKNKKIKTRRLSGTFKSGTSNFRIDKKEPTQFFHLMAYHNNRDNLNLIKEELSLASQCFQYALSNGFSWIPFSAPLLLLTRESKKRKDGKVTTHKTDLLDEQADTDLSKFIASATYKNLTELQKNILVGDLIEALKIMASLKIVHQDLKPTNILVCTDENGKKRLKITDFGLSVDQKLSLDAYLASATCGYESPEIRVMSRKKLSHLFKYFFEDNKNIKTWAKSLLEKIKKKVQDLKFRNKHEYSNAHGTNDIWAAGIIIFEILYGKTPENHTKAEELIENHPLLRCMLETSREKRASISNINRIYQQEILKNTNSTTPRNSNDEPEKEKSVQFSQTSEENIEARNSGIYNPLNESDESGIPLLFSSPDFSGGDLLSIQNSMQRPMPGKLKSSLF